MIGLFKTEMIRHAGPWTGLDYGAQSLEWVWFFNHHRLLEPPGYAPTTEYEAQYAQCRAAPVSA